MKNYFQLVKLLTILLISGLNMACAARFGPALVTGYSPARQPSPQPIVAVPLNSGIKPILETSVESKLRFTLDSVFFEIDKANLLPAGQRKIEEFATSIQRYGPSSTVQIDGYTDNTGEETYNQHLSERRADTVRAALIAKGITHAKLFTKGFGENNPLTTNATREGRQQNRRVEITVIK